MMTASMTLRQLADTQREMRDRREADGLGAMDQAVYQALALRAGRGFECWPSAERLARDVGCSVRTIWRCLKRLAARGWIEVQRRRHEGLRTFRTNLYRLVRIGGGSLDAPRPETDPAGSRDARAVRQEEADRAMARARKRTAELTGREPIEGSDGDAFRDAPGDRRGRSMGDALGNILGRMVEHASGECARREIAKMRAMFKPVKEDRAAHEAEVARLRLALPYDGEPA